MTRRPVVAVAMSGGVDSSVAAALCVQAGYEVVGIMLRLWYEAGATGANKCCTVGAIDDARRVAAILDIPFSVLDIEDLFHEVIVEPFLAQVLDGDTPNPCLSCNRRVRFGHLLNQARALGADYLATGHYAQVKQDADGVHWLHRGADRDKDQSYVLHRLDQAQLAQAMFPVGGYTKPEVRRLAEGFGLPVASRADSMDLCWIGPGGMRGFLERNLPAGAAVPGPIVDTGGRVLGEHQGLPFYTRGQRRGLGVATGDAVYVVGKDVAANALVVGPSIALDARHISVRAMHWSSGQVPGGLDGSEGPEDPNPLRITAQIRYRAADAPAWLTPALDASGRPAAAVVFDAPQRAPTAGQALVVYDGDRVLGGGLIAAEGGW